MSGRHQVSVTATATAPPAEVYALLCDRAAWPSWSKAGSYESVEGVEGTVGAVARFTIGPVAIVERIVELVDDERFAYELLSGLPVRNYRADVVLTGTTDGGTRIDWGATFDAAPGMGRLLRVLLRRVLSDITAALVRRAS
jgi:uncharacterized protein YndB with AHSA1/START domain